MAAEVKAVLLTVAAFGLLLTAACGGSNDTTALKSQVAALQTQVAQPTPPAERTATSQPEPDRVVGVTYRSNVGLVRDRGAQQADQGLWCLTYFSPQYCGRYRQGDPPVPPDCLVVTDLVLTVTVRTPDGHTYNASIDGSTTKIPVALGDPWPPK